MMRNPLPAAIAWLFVLSCSAPMSPPPPPNSAAVLLLVRGAEGTDQIRIDDNVVARLVATDGGWVLQADHVSATLGSSARSIDADQPYPRREVIEGRLAGPGGAAFRQEYTRLAPPAPLPIEGLGLEVASDEPGLNREQHDELRAWLASQQLARNTAPFEAVHEADAGRELTVWYEVSGRRKNGIFTDASSGDVLASFDSLYRSEDGKLKIHHKRTGENGRFSYHRRSLELADTIAANDEQGDALQAHHCGCYGYAIAADAMTLGDLLYQVEADWLDDRVGAGFFLGLEQRDGFPWIGLGDRRRMRDLARRATAYYLKDARGDLFAEVRLDLPSNPSSPGLGPIRYRISHSLAGGPLVALARVEHTESEIRIDLYGDEEWEASLERLDSLLAAMPTQVERGDGVRDSHLGEIERLVDWVRLLRNPGASQLADVVSDVDALHAADKVRALLAPEIERFTAGTDDTHAMPPALMRGPG
ncbi:MAG: hypothetical protein GY725_08215 [bacterium]|nr:hypothetical protein [bacterium]